MDDMVTSGQNGKKLCGFNDADGRHGGGRLQLPRGSDKHVTAVIITAAVGNVLPPFFILAGKSGGSIGKSPLKWNSQMTLAICTF